MATPDPTIVTKLLRKLGMAVLISTLALITYALSLFVRDHADFNEHRAQRITQVEAERTKARTQLSEVSKKANVDAALLATQQQRAQLVEKSLKTLHELDPGTVDKLLGDKEQLAAHDAQLARAVALQAETQTRIAELQRDVAASSLARSELEQKLADLEREQSQLKTEDTAMAHYMRAAWTEGRWLIYLVLFSYLFGWLAISAILYYGWAPLAAKGRAMQLRKADVEPPAIGECSMGVEHSLWPGERLWVRKRFLETADMALTRRKRLLPDWRRPLGWLLCGAYGLVELRNERSDGERQVVFTSMRDPFAELVMVSVPEGGSFVVRAGFVKGLVSDIGLSPVIRRHWRVRSWQAWVSGQFGYLEFYGPCRLLVSCVSKLEGHTLTSDDEANPTTCRTRLAGVVGFSPQLSLHPVRTEGFWRYYRRQTPLFDLRLAGSGAYLTRELEARGRDDLKARVLKRFGL